MYPIARVYFYFLWCKLVNHDRIHKIYKQNLVKLFSHRQLQSSIGIEVTRSKARGMWQVILSR